MTAPAGSFAVTAIVVAACILFAAVVLFATWRYMRRDDDLFPFEAASAEWARALNPNVSRAGGPRPGSEDRASLPRPCCDHCNNLEGDPDGHDFGDASAHEGPCAGCADDGDATLTTMLAIHARDRREFLAAGLGHTRDLLARAEAVLAVTGC